MPHLLSLQVGMPQEVVTETRQGHMAWTSGIFKAPVEGPVWLGTLNLKGDGQADLTVHGGPDKAVLACSADHYHFWREEFPDIDWQPGAFGENFTIAGLTEDDVCISDIYSIGEAIIQVSQPRQPCWKLAAKLERPTLPKWVIKTGFSGWYFRVLQEGIVAAGQTLQLVERTIPDNTIAAVNRYLYEQ